MSNRVWLNVASLGAIRLGRVWAVSLGRDGGVAFLGQVAWASREHLPLHLHLHLQDGFAIRAGHHCTQPLHRSLGAAGSARASLYVYNTKEEIDGFVESLSTTLTMFEELDAM